MLAHMLTGAERQLPCQAVVLVTDRLPQDGLYQELKPHLESGRLESLKAHRGLPKARISSPRRSTPGTWRAREFGEPLPQGTPFKVERTSLED